MSTLRAMFGIIVLTIPYCFKGIGILTGLFGCVFALFLAVYGNNMLIDSIAHIGETVHSYGEVAGHALGPWGKTYVDFCISFS